MTQVIYKIVNLVNDKFYVGSTANQRERFRTHRKKLRRGVHHCAHLQAAWNKYGEEKFRFYVIEEVPENESLQAAEDRWLLEHVGKEHCYNTGMMSGAPWRGTPKEKHPNFGVPKSEEQREKISRSLKEFYAKNYFNHPRVGKTHNEETKERIRQAKLANPQRAWLGKERDEETRAKIGDAQRGKPKAPGRKVSEEGRAKIRANIEAGRSHMHWLGRKHTEEARARMSRRVLASFHDGQTMEFGSLTATLEHFSLKMPSLNRALKSGKPLAKGPRAGWSFKYVDTPTSA